MAQGLPKPPDGTGEVPGFKLAILNLVTDLEVSRLENFFSVVGFFIRQKGSNWSEARHCLAPGLLI